MQGELRVTVWGGLSMLAAFAKGCEPFYHDSICSTTT